MTEKRATRTALPAWPARAWARRLFTTAPDLDPEDLIEIEQVHGLAHRVEAEHRWHANAHVRAWARARLN
jgi:hypothetical protein